MSGNQILDNLVYNQSTGTLSYKGVRYLLIRPETIVGFQKGLVQSCGKKAENNFYEGGFIGGSLSAQKYRALHNFSDYEIIEFMMNMGNQIGWGNFSLKKFDPQGKHLCVIVGDSAFARAYGRSAEGVCHLIRGVLAGMASELFDGVCKSEEVECLARGDRICRFEISG